MSAGSGNLPERSQLATAVAKTPLGANVNLCADDSGDWIIVCGLALKLGRLDQPKPFAWETCSAA